MIKWSSVSECVSHREVNPYKKVATFASFFLCTLVDQGVHLFFSYPTNIFSNKVKKVTKEYFYIVYLLFKFIYNDFLKIFNIVRKEIGRQHEKKSELKQLLFLRVYLSGKAKT